MWVCVGLRFFERREREGGSVHSEPFKVSVSLRHSPIHISLSFVRHPGLCCCGQARLAPSRKRGQASKSSRFNRPTSPQMPCRRCLPCLGEGSVPAIPSNGPRFPLCASWPAENGGHQDTRTTDQYYAGAVVQDMTTEERRWRSSTCLGVGRVGRATKDHHPMMHSSPSAMEPRGLLCYAAAAGGWAAGERRLLLVRVYTELVCVLQNLLGSLAKAPWFRWLALAPLTLVITDDRERQRSRIQ